MKREDLRSRIIPTTNENTDESQKMENKKFNTTDLIYLDSYDEQYNGEKTDEERRISATDYAQMNNAYIDDKYETRSGRPTTQIYLRTTSVKRGERYCIDSNGCCFSIYTGGREIGLCPSLHYNLSSDISKRSGLRPLQEKKNREGMEESEFDIREVKDTKGKTIYHTLQIGEYPKTKVEDSLTRILESLYHGGKIKEGILSTGRWYSGNGNGDNNGYAGKHSPEFEYQGNRYVRVIAYKNDNENRYTDNTTGEIGTIRWVKVEPISFIIKNWGEMPKSINPNGTGKAKYFDLRAEEAIIANIPLSFRRNKVEK